MLLAQFDFVKNCESDEGKSAIEDFMLSAVENRCEGLMIKVGHAATMKANFVD